MLTVKRLVVVLIVALVGACSDDASNDGAPPGIKPGNQSNAGPADCSQQLRVDGNVFTSHGYTKHRAVKHSTAERAECHDTGPDAAGSVFTDSPSRVTTWTFTGYPPDKVLGVEFGSADSFAVFVADSVPPSERDRIYDELAAPPPTATDSNRP